MKSGMKSQWMAVLFCFAVGLLFGSPAGAQNQSLYSVSNKAKLQMFGAFGFGADSETLGTTANGDPVKLSNGGGAGFGVGAGYAMSDRFDLDVDLGYQVSTLTPAVANATGTFSRNYFLVTAKYKIPIDQTMQLKFGLGAGLYMGGKLDINTSSVPGGGKMAIDYGTATGFHGIGEMEFNMGNDLFFTFGMKYYAVTYPGDSGTLNGAPIIPKDRNGSGLDLLAAFGKYF